MKKALAMLLSVLLLVACVPLGAIPVAADHNHEPIETQPEDIFDVTIAVTENYDEIIDEIVILNQVRVEHGLSPLTLDPQMTAWAMQRAAECVVNYSHSRPNGTVCFTIMEYPYIGGGENIAMGYLNAAGVMDGWMNSPGHRANILNADFASVGLGCAEDSDGYKYWVQLFSFEEGTPFSPTGGRVYREHAPIRFWSNWLTLEYNPAQAGVMLVGDVIPCPAVLRNTYETPGQFGIITGGVTITTSSDIVRVDESNMSLIAVSPGTVEVTVTVDNGYRTISVTGTIRVTERLPLTYCWESDGSLTLQWENTHPDDVLLYHSEEYPYYDEVIHEVGDTTSITIDNLDEDRTYTFTLMDSTVTTELSNTVTLSTHLETHVYDDDADLVCNDCGYIRAPRVLEYILEDGYAWITGVTDPEVTHVDIPAAILGRPVTTVKGCAFYDCTSLQSVTIPDSVTIIGSSAFYSCTSLTSLTIPDSVATIENGAFADCTSLESVAIPNGITAINDSVFRGCTALTAVIIPDGVTTIGGHAFYDCTSLESVTIPDGVTSIGEYAFSDCPSLESVTIPDSVTTMGYGVFAGCDSLTTVILGDGLTEIKNYLFDDCTSLTSVTIGKAVASIGKYAFDGYHALTSFVVSAENPAYSSVDGVLFNKDKTALLRCFTTVGESYTIPDGVTTIASDAFENCGELRTLVVPASLATVEEGAFLLCDNLEAVFYAGSEWDWSQISIGDYNYDFMYADIYYDCADENLVDGLRYEIVGGEAHVIGYLPIRTEVVIPATVHGYPVTAIGDQAFEGWQGLTSVVIPDSVKVIGKEAFHWCYGLTVVEMGLGVTTIGESAFEICNSLTSVSFTNAVTSIGEDAFHGCNALTDVYYVGSEWDREKIADDYGNGCLWDAAWHYTARPTGTTGDCTWELDGTHLIISGNGRMEDYSWNSSEPRPWGDQVTKVTIEDGVTYVGARAFLSISTITSVTIADSVTTIGDWAFYGCVNLSDLTIGNNVTTIGAFALGDCWALQSVALPDSVTTIDMSALSGCSSLKTVFLGDGITHIAGSAFDGCPALTDVYYAGSEADREKIEIGSLNDSLKEATWHYNYAPDVPTIIPGDADGNGKVNNRDLGRLQQYLNEWDVTVNKDAADLDGNGRINNRDLGLLQQLLNQ